jgi:hypothetical protein
MGPLLALLPEAAATATAATAAATTPTLATLASYASLASGGIGALASLRSGMTQAAVANANAEAAKFNAGSSMNAAEAEAARIQANTRRTLATAANTGGASGIQTGSGSALDVMGDMAAQGSLDAQIARWRGFTQGGAYQTQAGQQSAAAAAAPLTGALGAGTTLLTSFGNYANQRAYAQGLVRQGAA